MSNKIYNCPFCGTPYANAEDVMKCMNMCSMEMKKTELENAKSEVEAAVENLTAAIAEYNKLSTTDLYKFAIKLEKINGSKTSAIKENVYEQLGKSIGKLPEKEKVSSETTKDFNSFLKSNFNIKEPKKVEQESVVDMLRKLTKTLDNPAQKEKVTKELNELENIYNSFTEDEKKDIDALFKALTFGFVANPQSMLNKLDTFRTWHSILK